MLVKKGDQNLANSNYKLPHVKKITSCVCDD